MSTNNQKKLVDLHIFMLLHEYNSVIVPNLGGFEGAFQVAHIEYATGKMTPPSKAISFNPNLVLDDGRLIDAISKTAHLPRKEAIELVKEYALLAKEVLHKKKFSIEKVGVLFKNIEGHICFDQEKYNFNTNNFGLPDIRYKPIIRKKAVATSPKVVPPSTAAVSTSRKLRKSKLIFPIAASVLVVGLVAFLVLHYINGVGSQTDKKFSDINSVKTEKTAETLTERINVKPFQASDEEHIVTPDEEMLTDEIPYDEPDSSTSSKEITSPSSPTDIKDFGLIVVGKFRLPRGIETMTAKIVSLDMIPYTYSDGDATVVAVKYFKSRNDLPLLLDSVRQEIEPAAWVKK